MGKIFLFFLAASIFLIKIDAQAVCNVGEAEEAVGGYCNKDKGDEKCKEHCTARYGAELLNSACSAARKNGKKECVCSLKCANGGCWGDPHCWSFDGTKFGYQGLKRYYVFKPCKPFPTLPEFEIIQTNKLWGGGPVSVLDNIEFLMTDWGVYLDIKLPTATGVPFVLKVNREVKAIPFRYSRQRGHREEFINVDFKTPQILVIETSFGLRITLTSVPCGATAYADISVDIPRHPELKGNTCGILGRWNDNPADDNIDSTGKQQPLDDGYSHAFGDSWVVQGSGIPTECELELAKLAHDDQVKRVSKETKDHARRLCKENLEQANVHSCAKEMRRPAHAVTDCVLDLIFIEGEAAQTAFLKAMLAKFIHECPHHNITFKKVPPCNELELIQLFRFHHPTSGDYFHAASPGEVIAGTANGWTFQQIDGRVAVGPTDCEHDAKGLKPIYHLYGGQNDHFFTSNAATFEHFKANGYNMQPYIIGYCSPTQNHCGASVPWRRYLVGNNHFQAPGDAAPAGAVDQGDVCYIWPPAPAVEQI